MSRNQAREQRATERLSSTLNGGDHRCEQDEVGRCLHIEAEDTYRGVDSETNEDRGLGSDPSGNAAEQEGERNADKLHDQDCANEDRIRYAQLLAVRRRHLLNGLDPIIIDHEREQHEQRLLVASECAKGLRDPDKRSDEYTPSGQLIGLASSGWFRNAAEEGN